MDETGRARPRLIGFFPRKPEEKFHEPIPPRRRVQGRLPEAEGGEVVFPEVFCDRAREESLEDVRRIMEASNNETTRGFVMTIAERLQLEGEQRGKLDSIQTLLRKRFGNVPFELEKRLEDSSIEVLDRFLVDFLDLDSLSDVHRWWRTRSEGGTV